MRLDQKRLIMYCLLVLGMCSCEDQPEITKYYNVDFVNGSSYPVDSIKIRFVLTKTRPGYVVDSFMIRKPLNPGDTTKFLYSMEQNSTLGAIEGIIDIRSYRKEAKPATYKHGFFGDTEISHALYRATILNDTIKMCFPLLDFSRYPNEPNSPYKCD